MHLSLRGLSFVLVSGALGACAQPSVSGTLTDGLTGDPIPKMRLIASATGKTSANCTAFETYSDVAGAFTFPSVCSDTAYQLKPGDKNVWLADGDTLPKGGAEGLSFKGYLAPEGTGVYRLHAGELERLPTTSDLRKDKIWNHETEMVQYPRTVPEKPASIGEGSYLVVMGSDNIEKMSFQPLIPSGDRRFGSDKTIEIRMKPWSYIGTVFNDDTTFERKSVSLDTTKVVDKKQGERVARFIPQDALPKGRYVFHKDGDDRTMVLSFGSTEP